MQIVLLTSVTCIMDMNILMQSTIVLAVDIFVKFVMHSVYMG